jgi:hypothetical protein
VSRFKSFRIEKGSENNQRVKARSVWRA